MKLASRLAAYQTNSLDGVLAARDAQTIAFAGGYPDPALFPQADLARAWSQSASATTLQYAGPSGDRPLRAQLAQRMSQDSIPCTPADVMLTQGAQQALDLTAKLLLDPGDGLVVEGPTYIGALSAFDAYQPTYYEVPVQADGLDLTALQQVLASHKVKLIYTVPDFQNPTGTVMSLAKRRALVALANRYDVVIVEDAPYRELRYQGVQLPPIKAFDTQDRVVFVSSFSKILAPSLRLGWLVAGPRLMAPLRALKGGCDLETSGLTTAAVAAYLQNHDLDRHIARLRAVYSAKLARMHTALTRALPEGFAVTRPDGGFFLWLTGPADFDAMAFAQGPLRAANVTVIPGSGLSPFGHFHNAARLSFTGASLDEIDRGCARLCAALAQAERPARAAAR
ncbi:PLP-dependent aminotransferase family protein [Lacticaseibacillus kribbianus]|uniref:aminotransferase-like domain-containing protein n=1 Tax=Lacticaseibacillus kribbianus TaxID=2926292 RepID=UPI001CD69C16|nr:PLP-dependent aminotransferase family protein [Lacticaseibacillus kribbianus]